MPLRTRSRIGGTAKKSARDVRGGRLVATVTDSDGNVPASRSIEAWREVNQLPDCEMMHNGRWLV